MEKTERNAIKTTKAILVEQDLFVSLFFITLLLIALSSRLPPTESKLLRPGSSFCLFPETTWVFLFFHPFVDFPLDCRFIMNNFQPKSKQIPLQNPRLILFARLQNEGLRPSRTRQWPFEEVYFGKKALPQNASRANLCAFLWQYKLSAVSAKSASKKNLRVSSFPSW